MSSEHIERRLAAILAADVVGSCRLMGSDEEGTLAQLQALGRTLVDPKISEHHGRIVKNTGDGALVEFASPVDAVRCADEIQRCMAEQAANVPQDRRIEFRIGIHVGDIIIGDDDIFGDGVNIAVRLETLAEPGGIVVSHTAYDYVRNKVKVGFDDIGAHALKNIAEPVHAYRVSGTPTIAMTVDRAVTEKPSIAVLPFDNMSSGEDQQYFGDGISDDIIIELSRFRQLRVLARNSSFQFRGPNVDVGRVGRELGIQYVLEGSVRRLGDRIRITAQLIDASSGHHIWADRFDRPLEELFDVQDRVVRTIVGTLVGRLQADRADRAKRKPPTSLAAYECVLRGDALPVYDAANEAEARRLLKRAIELDPEYAKPHALLAFAFCREWYLDLSGSSDTALNQALASAKRAVELDDGQEVCLAALGWVLMHRRSYDLAEYHYARALALNPNNPTVRANLGDLYLRLGDPVKCLEYFKEAKVIDPFFAPKWYWGPVGRAYFMTHQYDDAIAAFARYPSTRFWGPAHLAACYALTGNKSRSNHYAAEVLRLMPEFSISRFVPKELYRLSSDCKHLTDALRKAGLPE
ncbi:adenylate/guanylate cyclase domain-containing protein [Bradyrhizobium arachidis]|uniref:Tetratricopeptide repeat protein n=1 Tax=Bradyrhizobium arachidis TaxID=858423 RepID=A0AAE7NIZ5_9BRAD|nr:adenylate/guanylate cyclase domain-containing protein [Bradyrhizobium arachidis]QOZ66207.1 tetratricopeptide repeat protein [Bradyrhizobium arachidis]